MSQSSKSSVTLSAVWRTLTLAGEEPRSRRSVHILHLGPNHLHLSEVLFIIFLFFNLNVGFWCDLEEPYVKITTSLTSFSAKNKTKKNILLKYLRACTAYVTDIEA